MGFWLASMPHRASAFHHLTHSYRAADRKGEGGRGERPSRGEGPIMDLSAAILQETLTKVKSDKASGNAARRVRPRVGLRCSLTIIPYANGACRRPLKAWTRGISLGGVGILTSISMKAGGQVI